MLIHNSQSIMMVLNHLPSPTHDALTLRGHNRAGNSLTNFLVYCQWAIFTRPRLAHEVVQIDGIIFGWLHMVQKSGIQKDVLSPTVILALLFGHFWRCRSLGLSMQDTCTGLLHIYDLATSQDNICLSVQFGWLMSRLIFPLKFTFP